MRIDNSSTIGSIHIDNNNWFPFPWKFLADLEVSESKIIWEKNKKSIDFTIKNRGTLDSHHFIITIYAKEENGSIEVLGKFSISKLEVNKRVQKSFDLIHASIHNRVNLDSVKEIIIKVDSNNEVKESNEKNNIKVLELNKTMKYTIEVETGDVPHAGTDAGVYIRLYGRRRVSDYIQLDNSENNHEKGKKDIYTISHKDLGTIRKIEVKHDNRGKHPGWFLEKILIKDDSDNYSFTANEWLSSSSKNEHPTITLMEDDLREEYRVTVTTSNIADAGTDATVYMRLYGEGEHRETSLQRIGHNLSDFEKGTTKTYTIRSDFDLGEVEKIYIEHDNTGKGPWWHLEKVVVVNRHNHSQSTFNINKWIGGRDNKIVAFKNSPIKELEIDHTRQVKISISDNVEKIELLADGKNYSFNCLSGPYQGCGIDAGHSFMGWFQNNISRGTIHRYIETTNLTGTPFGDFKSGDTFTSPAQMSNGLNRLVNKIQPQYKNKITRHHKNDDNFVIKKIRDYLRTGMPVVALINKGYHWVTIVGMECKYSSTKKIDLNHSYITYIDLTHSDTYRKSYSSLKICGWSSSVGHFFYGSYEAGTIISLHNHLLKSSYAKKAYRFEIHTSEVLGAGTDANIHITLHGKNGHSATYTIDTICNDFEKGTNSIQSFIVNEYMSEIRSITVRRNNSGSHPDWHVSYIDVVETKTGENDGRLWHFPIYDWIDSVQEESFPQAHKDSYTIKVKTGEIKNAGTDARVYIKLYGSSGNSKFLQLDNARDNHEKGDLDIYTIPHKNIGSIKKIEIKHDSTGEKAGWYVEKISITHQSHTYNFTIGEWLLKGSGSIFSIEDHLR